VSGGELMILGKLALTFGMLIGLPLWDLYRLRHDLRRIRGQRHSERRGTAPTQEL
jgi:hypothetical protein